MLSNVKLNSIVLMNFSKTLHIVCTCVCVYICVHIYFTTTITCKYKMEMLPFMTNYEITDRYVIN